jgi:hypothetical protein
MAWIYLAESEDLRSHSESGLSPSHTVKETHFASHCFCLELVMGNCLERQSGTTLHRLTAPCYHLESTSSMEASPAKTSALRAMEQAWAASEVDFSSTSQGLSAKQTRDLYFSKTSQQLELVASMVSVKHLPNSGMIVGGRLYQPKKLEPRTCVNDGSCLPTPTATPYGSNQGGAAGRKGPKRASLNSLASLWPSPQARDWKDGLTPKPHGRHSDSVAVAVAVAKSGHKGYLNPQFVEVLMGFQVEWTALEGWAMQWCRSKRKQRLKG